LPLLGIVFCEIRLSGAKHRPFLPYSNFHSNEPQESF
jgi:hypothetical protein